MEYFRSFGCHNSCTFLSFQKFEKVSTFFIWFTLSDTKNIFNNITTGFISNFYGGVLIFYTLIQHDW